MNNKRRGLALIFSQERFYWRMGLGDRQGSDADRRNLERRYLYPLLKKKHCIWLDCVLMITPLYAGNI